MTANDFINSLPAKINPEALKGIETCFHFNLDDGKLQKTVQVHNGKLELHDGLIGESKCTVTAKSDTLMRVIRGEDNPMMAMMMGKIKISNTSEMLKYAKLFGIM